MILEKKKSLFYIFIISYVLFPLTVNAQDDYKYEIGGMAGVNFYMGDANKTSLFKDLGPVGGAVFRYNIDLRWSVKTNLLVGHISGDTHTSGDNFPGGQQVKFDRLFGELGGQIEFNFFNYSDQFAYLGAKRFSPYVFTGLGFTFADGNKTFFDANIPIGIGAKYKIKERVNIGFEFSLRRLFSDNFDVTEKSGFDLNDPYEIKSSAMKNKDWYSLTMLSVTWNFGARPCPCLNID